MKKILEVPSNPLAECGLLGRGVPFELGHIALKISEVRRELPGSLFEYCELPFGSSLVVWVMVGAVKDVPEFLDGVKVDLVVDDTGVDHSVGIALEE